MFESFCIGQILATCSVRVKGVVSLTRPVTLECADGAKGLCLGEFSLITLVFPVISVYKGVAVFSRELCLKGFLGFPVTYV